MNFIKISDDYKFLGDRIEYQVTKKQWSLDDNIRRK